MPGSTVREWRQFMTNTKRTPQEKELGRYVSQVMSAKGLSAREVAAGSGGRITAGYVMGIMKGNAANPSVDKLAALASGLDMDLHELFDAACEPSERRAQQQQQQGTERLPTLELLDLMKKLAVSPSLAIPWLMKILEKAMLLSPDELEAVFNSVNTLVEAKGSPQRRTTQR